MPVFLCGKTNEIEAEILRFGKNSLYEETMEFEPTDEEGWMIRVTRWLPKRKFRLRFKNRTQKRFEVWSFSVGGPIPKGYPKVLEPEGEVVIDFILHASNSVSGEAERLSFMVEEPGVGSEATFGLSRLIK